MKASAWMSLAAAQGNKKATENKDVLKLEMIPEQVAEA